MPTIQDDFTRSNSTGLGTATVGGVSQGYSWSNLFGLSNPLNIASNTAAPNGFGSNGQYANSSLGSADNFCQATFTVNSSLNYMGICARFTPAGSGDQSYLFTHFGGELRLYRCPLMYDLGTWVLLANTSGAGPAGEVYYLEVTGTNPVHLVCKKSGSAVITYDDSNSNRLQTGNYSALWTYGVSNLSSTITAFSAGSIGGGGGGISPINYYNRMRGQ